MIVRPVWATEFVVVLYAPITTTVCLRHLVYTTFPAQQQPACRSACRTPRNTLALFPANMSTAAEPHQKPSSTVASQAAPAPAGPPGAAAAPGQPTSIGQKVLNTATSALQSFKPLNKICQHVCAFHCYAHDTTRQVNLQHPVSSDQHSDTPNHNASWHAVTSRCGGGTECPGSIHGNVAHPATATTCAVCTPKPTGARPPLLLAPE